MNNIYESSPHIKRMGRSIRTVVATPEVSDPIVQGDTRIDARGAEIYGSVIQDGGIFRMWYQAWPDDFDGKDMVSVAYAESDDGLNWRKPHLGLVDYYGNTDNNLVNLPLHCPSVFIDPTAPPSHRYRATGHSQPNYMFSGKPVALEKRGYYSAHSSDGLHWTFDKNEPTWPGSDVITSCWDEFRDCGYVSLKRMIRTGGMMRRCFANAVLRDGEYSDAQMMLIPDDYDDIRARESGAIATDYYGMGWVPGPDLTFGLLWNYRIDQPVPKMEPDNYMPWGLYGQVDLSIVWRESPESIWQHLPGRPNFLAAGNSDTWYSGGLYTAGQSTLVGDEEWMYFTGTQLRHGDLMTNWEPDPTRLEKAEKVLSGIGVLRWKKGRLVGLEAPLYDELDLTLPADSTGKELHLNMRTWGEGSLRAELVKSSDGKVAEGFSREDCVDLRGDDVNRTVVWKGTSTLPDADCYLRLCLTRAAVYGYGVEAQSDDRLAAEVLFRD